jgi:hypothetical protein
MQLESFKISGKVRRLFLPEVVIFENRPSIQYFTWQSLKNNSVLFYKPIPNSDPDPKICHHFEQNVLIGIYFPPFKPLLRASLKYKTFIKLNGYQE